MNELEKVLVWGVTGAGTAVLMEPWAAWVHGRVWHGLLWPVHRSHHTTREGTWEANDVLALTHVPVAIGLILYGCLATPGLFRESLFGVGLGMTAFGLAYTVVHDGLVHGRLPVAWLSRWRYFERVRRAHRVHHLTGGAPHGLFLGPWRLRRRR